MQVNSKATRKPNQLSNQSRISIDSDNFHTRIPLLSLIVPLRFCYSVLSFLNQDAYVYHVCEHQWYISNGTLYSSTFFKISNTSVATLNCDLLSPIHFSGRPFNHNASEDIMNENRPAIRDISAFLTPIDIAERLYQLFDNYWAGHI